MKPFAPDFRIVLSDLHIGTGHKKGTFNPFEDFYEDEKFSELLRFYAEEYGKGKTLELVFCGDILDLMKVKVGKEEKFEYEITEEIACYKVHRCLIGHPIICEAISSFLDRGGTYVTILPGNHDIELLLPSAQKVFRDLTAPGSLGARVQFIDKTPTYNLPEGIQIHHGHMLESHLQFNYEKLMIKRTKGPPILDLPWGSLLLLKVIIPAKSQRYFVDHIYPLSRLILGGLIFDFRFTVRLTAQIIYQFFATRVSYGKKNTIAKIWEGMRVIKEAVLPKRSFDEQVERVLRRTMGVHTMITGHSHQPRYRLVGNNKLYVNTGTWVKMVNIDLEHLGQDSGLTYALIEYDESRVPVTKLYRWLGGYEITKPVHY